MAKGELDHFVKTRPPMFWWTLVNILAIAFAITSWIVCLNLFRDPIHPVSYELMRKVNRLQPLQAFTEESAPSPRRTYDPLSLEAEFQHYRKEERAALNDELLRSYLTNYEKTNFLTYVKGEFQVQEIRELTATDFFPQGIAIKAQAIVRPDNLTDPIAYPIFVECLFHSVPSFAADLNQGDTFHLKRSSDCAAILNID